ncbi:hypothetical protein [Actinokineospora bangkokensis]|uniref:Uncharacterized protein n=1 Tax=Actinokineospora bangkokensis TaxID=1193682 RepID=A0A1Q9LK39_9PSEU|nr:hypothetical protein [Actinokineospora bangkokensis]OLR92411.1 hypothetical protein BJP25_20200 [Actinokineospora bangkokensis]
MRDEIRGTEFTDSAAQECPLAAATTATSAKVGVRAKVLAGITLGIAGGVVIAGDISTVVSVHGPGAA